MAVITGEKPYRTAQEALTHVKNIFCVGRNYRDHAAELGNDVPSKPMIFGKSTHALAVADGVVRVPAGRENIHHELEIVLWMKGPYQPGAALSDVVGGIALGLDLTDRDAQTELKKAGHPWELAKGFQGSAVITDFYEVADWNALLETPFELRINGRIAQSGQAKDMIFSFDTLIGYVRTHFGLDADDLLFTGTPAGVGPLRAGDELELVMDGRVWGRCRVAQ
ncbi:fumarylacetoacetate hydrolase family protein [Alicyclobacillus macrosporangiidus]|uniref:2-keto-4-pentenoate hydratase/2-oxohepta-3-ene-1,7-dioic acid hydratase (Catechol pathway) n=1 Tax=Alicyclobacillus macrosporangiidus TaxID=392015 RepID=A0A1I7L3Q3_9BACL|nr:fumarylacetoacetate hydrolase family protein [Alicyclobacillus macrosporangiidus]SFV04136.1 2-keto-4-pentenoate hydratase/2-oxohepta-3-ene-1,7-dioic acid hydratase (catechol pathway) [Alicyclobacillus macrosporangiidus]